MYKLYTAPGAAGFAVHWLLVELGQPFDVILLNLDEKEQKSPAYLEINPHGKVPALIVDGVARSETTALLMLLAERHPDRGLAPLVNDPSRSDYLQWMVFLANTMLPAFRAWFYAEEPAGPTNADAAMKQARANIERAWDFADRNFADGRAHLLGSNLSAADFLLTMLLRWSRSMPRPASDWANLGRYAARMKELPSLREVHLREGLTDWIND